MREIQTAMEKASKEKAILLQYHDAIKAATEIGWDYTALTPEELISMFMAGEFEPTDPTPQEETRQTVKSGKGGKGGKGGRPKGQSQKRVHEYDKACAQYEEELLYTSGPVSLQERLLYTINKLFAKQVRSFSSFVGSRSFYFLVFTTQHRVHHVHKSIRYFHRSHTDSLQFVSFLSKFSIL